MRKTVTLKTKPATQHCALEAFVYVETYYLLGFIPVWQSETLIFK